MNHRLTSIALALALALLPGCGLGYVVESGWYQAELLASRVPNDDAVAQGRLSLRERQALDHVKAIKAFGSSIGLGATSSYEAVALDWERELHNIAASSPTAFEQETWWFPIVGTVPYLGFFSRADAEEVAADLRAEGLDVWVRRVGAYSTLGWFDDPLLPHMLQWSEQLLANVVLHEMTHATVWVNGGVRFNESLANFVGDVASLRYFERRYGPDAFPTRRAHKNLEDDARWRDLLLDLYRTLDALYTNPDLSDHDKLQQKAALFDALPRRVLLTGFHDPHPFLLAAVDGQWNNARLCQFKDYNSEIQDFQALLDRHDGDLLAFIQAVATLVEDADDPFQALHDAAHTHPEPASPRRPMTSLP